MKSILIAALFVFSFASMAATVKNTRTADSAVIARVVKVVPLVDKQDLKVNVSVVDLGGSTDVSPTQEVYFSVYLKGEMFSTDATFKLGQVFNLISAKRVKAGIYQVIVTDADLKESVLTIDATKALVAIREVNCGGEFDCAASAKFSSTIEVSKK